MSRSWSVAFLFLLMGCFSALAGDIQEPSAVSMQAALEEQIRNEPLMAQMMSDRLQDFVKLGCDAPVKGTPGLTCRYRATAMVMGQPNIDEDSSVFIRNSKGAWSVAD